MHHKPHRGHSLFAKLNLGTPFDVFPTASETRRNRLALGPRSRYQKLIHDLDPSAWYKATDGFGPSRTDAQADQALCFPVLCGDTCMRVWSSKHRGLSARRAALPWNLAFWLSITTATRPARYSSVELFGPLFRIPHPFAASWNPSPGTN